MELVCIRSEELQVQVGCRMIEVETGVAVRSVILEVFGGAVRIFGGIGNADCCGRSGSQGYTANFA